MSKSIGIKLADGTFYPILEEGVPAKKRMELTTVKDNQETVQVDLYRSENGSMEDAEYVDSLQIDKEVLIYSETDDSYYEVICHNVDWSGIDSLAIYLSDVTKKKKEEEKFLDVQEQRIKSTLNSKNVIWVLKVNLTKDITEGFTDILLNKNYYSKAVCYSEKMVTATKKMINNNPSGRKNKCK